MENWSYFDFFLGTYEGKKLKEKTGTCGRPASERVPYRTESDRAGRCRIKRSDGHETIPYFPGQWFAKRDDENPNGLFEASMLALLKPWRSLSDLKEEHETFQQAFTTFLSIALEDTRNTVENIEFFHECSTSARQHRHPNDEDAVAMGDTRRFDNGLDNCEIHETEESEELEPENEITQEDVLTTLDTPFSGRELTHAKHAMLVGFRMGALTKEKYCTAYEQPSQRATAPQVNQIRLWEDSLNSLSQTMDKQVNISSISDESAFEINGFGQMVSEPSLLPCSGSSYLENETNDDVHHHPNLNNRQNMAHNIVSHHLQQYLEGENPPQRLMIVHGQGGTGKSALLNTISKTFDDNGASSLLAKTAMTRVAATIIGGQTLHRWAALPIKTPVSDKWVTHPTKEIGNRRRRNMENVLWLTIDEKSMMKASQLAHLSQTTSFIRGGLHNVDASLPFGGLNVILLGDFHQFPPVASSTKELYNLSPQTGSCQLGRNLFEQFETVIKLEEQIHI